MDQKTGDNCESQSSEPFKADSLSVGLFVLFSMAVLQRAVGFIRSVGFCQYLDEETLGKWTMALGFINLAAPFFLLGLPGSIVRYLEHFRQQGQLQAFLRRILVGTMGLTIVAVSVMCLFPVPFAWLAFRDTEIVGPITAMSLAIFAIISFNFLEHIVSGLRQVRVASLMQFLNSVSFTVFSLGWLVFGGDLLGLIFSFTCATLVGCLPALWVLLRNWGAMPRSVAVLPRRDFLRKVAPYAASLWMINLLANVFSISDRYMILHFSPGGTEVGQALVGEYYSALMFPMLLLSLGVMIGGVLMPYMSADWETGRIRRVSVRMKKAILGLSALATICAVIGMLVSPFLFSHLFEGRYEQGLEVMPLAFVLCAWCGLITVSQDYLWCAEKGKLVGIALFVGLVTNIVLSGLLLPRFGLYGAVLATALAHLVVLVLILTFMHRHDFPLDLSIVFAVVLPATLVAGPWFSIGSLTLVLAVNKQSRYYTNQLRRQIETTISRWKSKQFEAVSG